MSVTTMPVPKVAHYLRTKRGPIRGEESPPSFEPTMDGPLGEGGGGGGVRREPGAAKGKTGGGVGRDQPTVSSSQGNY